MGETRAARSQQWLALFKTCPALLLAGNEVLPERLLLGAAFSLVISIISFRLRFLDGSGSLAGFVLGVIIFGIGGWPFSLPILFFFVGSSALSKISEHRRRDLSSLFQKSSRRDAGQVLANGGVATVLILVWHFASAPFWYFLFLGAVAAVTVDTWATEIGILFGRRPRSIKTWQSVPPGTSGGVTFAGFLGATLGASTIVVLGWLMHPSTSSYRFGWMGIFLLTAGGVLAHLLDSLFGATIQAQYLCPVCGKKTERRQHCNGLATTSHSGWRWVNDDVVNGFCALSGALIVFAALRLFEAKI